MYVLVEHDISRPAEFWGGAENMQLPADIQLHHTFANEDGSRAVCLWEGDSVESVRTFLEDVAGDWSRNEYFQVPNREGVAFPAVRAAGSRP